MATVNTATRHMLVIVHQPVLSGRKFAADRCCQILALLQKHKGKDMVEDCKLRSWPRKPSTAD